MLFFIFHTYFPNKWRSENAKLFAGTFFFLFDFFEFFFILKWKFSQFTAWKSLKTAQNMFKNSWIFLLFFNMIHKSFGWNSLCDESLHWIEWFCWFSRFLQIDSIQLEYVIWRAVLSWNHIIYYFQVKSQLHSTSFVSMEIN